MPLYDFQCKECGFTVDDVSLPIADRDRPLSEMCPSCGKPDTIERLAAAPGVSYSINRGGLKTPDSFKDMLKTIKKQHRHSTINVDA